jgi:hypothetical protein
MSILLMAISIITTLIPISIFESVTARDFWKIAVCGTLSVILFWSDVVLIIIYVYTHLILHAV